jgi:hypothetical protein
MHKPLKFLPGFKVSCLIVCGLDVVLAGGLFAKGLMESMAEYKVPPATLASPHYYDAIFWVYAHMIVIGLIIGGIGLLVKEGKAQLWLSRLLLVVHCFYAFLDFRSSDSVLGNGLYQGEASILPAFIGTLMALLFLHLSFGKAETA